MPELPDLQVFSRNLSKTFKSKKLTGIAVLVKGKTKASERELNGELSGKKLRNVARAGKQLCFDFGKDAQLFMHLMLHGKLVIGPTGEQPPKHTLAALDFGENVLYLTDFQKAAHLLLNPPAGEGLDALSQELTDKWLIEKLAGSRAKIKSLLMDQKVIAGIGNAYADEILWQARINPESTAGKIPASVVKKLRKAIENVLTSAEKEIAKAQPEIISGEIRDFLKIHNAKKETSPGGAKILTTTVGGRKSYYTDEQEMYR